MSSIRAVCRDSLLALCCSQTCPGMLMSRINSCYYRYILAFYLLPAQMAQCEPQRYPALALGGQLLAARVQLVQGSRPTLSVPWLRREAPHALQLQPAQLGIRSRAGPGPGGESGQHSQQPCDHLYNHLHLSSARHVNQHFFAR